MTKEYPWYEIAKGEDDLLQGDFVDECPIVIPPMDVLEKVEVAVDINKYNVVVISQSCDIAQKKLDLVLVCPVWPLEDVGKKEDYYNGRAGKEALRRGHIPSYHLLNKCELEGFRKDYQVVDFRNVFGVPIDLLQNLARSKEKRLRLLPPYREHLSQSFARFFMRVGLPAEIPAFK